MQVKGCSGFDGTMSVQTAIVIADRTHDLASSLQIAHADRHDYVEDT